MLKTLWERYIFKKLSYRFLFFLVCFFFLYILIDFSTHIQDFISSGKVSLDTLGVYYTYQFVKRIPLLLPLSLLIATIQVLYSLNSNREMLALQASGISLKKIFRPFVILGVFCSLFAYANEEFFTPKSMAYFDHLKSQKNSISLKEKKKRPFFVLQLEDASKLVYQSYDPKGEEFFDVYWIRSFDDIWKMQTLRANPQEPLARFADHITRDKKGFLEKTHSYESILLSDLKWELSQLNSKQTAVRYQKISTLTSMALATKSTSFYLRGEIQTYFLYKLVMPLFSLLVLFAIAPFCISYSRNIPIFLIYSIAIFSFVLFFTFMNAMVIIAENQVISPFSAILIPFLGCLTIFYINFYRVNTRN